MPSLYVAGHDVTNLLCLHGSSHISEQPFSMSKVLGNAMFFFNSYFLDLIVINFFKTGGGIQEV